METATLLDDGARVALVTRLKPIEGQARGIQLMLNEGRDCQETLDQLAALRAAAPAVSMQALEAFALRCLRESADSPEQVMARMLGVVAKLTR